MGVGLPYAPKAGRKGNILQVVSLIAQNCQEVIVTDGKYFPEIQGPYAPNWHPRPVYDKTQLHRRWLGGVTSNAQN